MSKRFFPSFVAISMTLSASLDAAVSPTETQAIAKEAYIYGYPLVDNYRIVHAYYLNPANPEHRGPLNQLASVGRVYTPEDKAIQTPNSDTPYTFAAFDLRAEPFVLTLPPIEPERYYSVQCIDLYTFNYDYLGTRTTGNGGGHYLLAGPGWKGETPKGIAKVIRSETELIMPVIRTQLFNPTDLAKVKAIQAGYKALPLSAFLGQPPPAPAPPNRFIAPLTPKEIRTSPEFFDQLAFLLRFCPVHPSEKELRARFEKIGILPGQKLDVAALDAGTKTALVAGMEDGQKAIEAHLATVTSSADGFGTREFLKNNYVVRAGAALAGIYGNSKEEAYYVPIDKDAEGKPLDGSRRYTLRFGPGQLPPVNAFWSLTMYELPTRLLVANPLKRYLINSPMLPDLKKDADGGLTLYLQHESPGADKESNWLPAPAKSPWMVMRLYLPKPAVLDGSWKAPKVQAVE